jgi:hypothetical protein
MTQLARALSSLRYHTDLGQIVTKYIGETEKNLWSELLDRATRSTTRESIRQHCGRLLAAATGCISRLRKHDFRPEPQP